MGRILLWVLWLVTGFEEDTAAIRGKVTFAGELPTGCSMFRRISVDSDCELHRKRGIAIESENFILDQETKGIKNVIVFVRGKVEDKTYPLQVQPAQLRHEECVFVPHVLTLRVDQPLEIRNQDSVVHHHHVHAEKNTPLNITWPSADVPRTEVFKVPEIFPIKCDVHPWEWAIVGVFDHPFHAVTGADGSFEIKGLPIGTYTMVAWHEEFGEAATTEVTVTGGETKEANIEIKGK